MAARRARSSSQRGCERSGFLHTAWLPMIVGRLTWNSSSRCRVEASFGPKGTCTIVPHWRMARMASCSAAALPEVSMATSTPWLPVARLIRSPASSAVGSTVRSAPSAKARARRPSIGSTAITVVAPLRAAIWTVIRADGAQAEHSHRVADPHVAVANRHDRYVGWIGAHGVGFGEAVQRPPGVRRAADAPRGSVRNRRRGRPARSRRRLIRLRSQTPTTMFPDGTLGQRERFRPGQKHA